MSGVIVLGAIVVALLAVAAGGQSSASPTRGGRGDLYSLIGMTQGQRQRDADVEWLGQFTRNNIADSETTARQLAVEYEKAHAVWCEDRLSASKYGEMIRAQEAAEDAWELGLANYAEHWAATALR